MSKKVAIQDTLTSFFYDLAKAVPIGTLNRVLINTVVTDVHENPVKVEYSDSHLRDWAQAFAQQLLNYKTKFTQTQLNSMQAPMAVATERED